MKRIVSILLSCALILGITACNDKNGNRKKNRADKNESTNVTSTDNVADTVDEKDVLSDNKNEDLNLTFDEVIASTVASFGYEDKRIKVCSASRSDQTGEPGEVLSVSPLTVAAAGGSVVIGDVIPQGSRRMTGAEWARGRRLTAGSRIGTDA